MVLAALASAPAAWAQPTAARPAPLQTLVNEAVVQLQLSYRHDSAELQRRYEAIGRAIAAWNQSARSQADGRQLSDWLRRSMQASMPGSREAMPPTPEFSQRPAPPVETLMPQPPATTSTSMTPAPAAEGNADAAPTPEAVTAEGKPPARFELPMNNPAEERPAPVNGQATPAKAPRDMMEGDPFRDDPLPEEREK